MSYWSRFPQIEAELTAKGDILARTVAELTAAGARDRVPVDTGKLRDAIHVDRTHEGVYSVVAGDTEAFYGHIVEHGGAFTPGRPFLIPAFELARARVQTLGANALRSL